MPKYCMFNNTSNFVNIGHVIVVVALIVLALNCAGPHGPEESGGQSDGSDGKRATTVLTPSSTPEETVRVLYNDEIFFNLRNEVTHSVIMHLSPCMTTELRSHFERHIEVVDAWMIRNKGALKKLPVSEGPIFLSNYEGADTYQVRDASIKNSHARVPVSLSITDMMGQLDWVDVALLRRVGSVWLLDDIEFQPDKSETYTLRDRISLIE